MEGYWKIYLKNKKIIDDEKIYLLDTGDDYVKCYLKEKKDIFYIINKDEFLYAEWIKS